MPVYKSGIQDLRIFYRLYVGKLQLASITYLFHVKEGQEVPTI